MFQVMAPDLILTIYILPTVQEEVQEEMQVVILPMVQVGVVTSH